jgi:hypothetical protein
METKHLHHHNSTTKRACGCRTARPPHHTLPLCLPLCPCHFLFWIFCLRSGRPPARCLAQCGNPHEGGAPLRLPRGRVVPHPLHFIPNVVVRPLLALDNLGVAALLPLSCWLPLPLPASTALRPSTSRRGRKTRGPGQTRPPPAQGPARPHACPPARPLARPPARPPAWPPARPPEGPPARALARPPSGRLHAPPSGPPSGCLPRPPHPRAAACPPAAACLGRGPQDAPTDRAARTCRGRPGVGDGRGRRGGEGGRAACALGRARPLRSGATAAPCPHVTDTF